MRRLALAALGLLLTACATGKDAVATGTEFEFVSPGGAIDLTYEGADRQRIPELSGEDLMAEGKQLALSSFAGDVVVLNIWESACPPCRVEAPQLQQLFDDGTQVLGINVRDHARSAPQDFTRDRDLTYPSIYDPAGRSLLALKGYPRTVVPSTIVLDKEHRVAAVFLRDVMAEDLTPLLDRLRAES